MLAWGVWSDDPAAMTEDKSSSSSISQSAAKMVHKSLDTCSRSQHIWYKGNTNIQEWQKIMPFKSEKQRKYLHANHPEIAQRWEKNYKKGGSVGKNKNKKKGKKK